LTDPLSANLPSAFECRSHHQNPALVLLAQINRQPTNKTVVIQNQKPSTLLTAPLSSLRAGEAQTDLDQPLVSMWERSF
jgi:hypothetical protein